MRIQKHIDYITPAVKMSQISKSSRMTSRMPRISSFSPVPDRSERHQARRASVPKDLKHCGDIITPACIRALYGIPEGTRNITGNNMGLYEAGDTYSQADIDAFFAKYAPYVPKGTTLEPAYIDGAKAPVGKGNVNNMGESDTDIVIAYPLIYPQGMTLYQTDDRHRTNQEDDFTKPYLNGQFNTFLDALDGVSLGRLSTCLF